MDSYLETETETETKGEKENNRVTSVICGEIPEGFIICGWILKTNANSKYYDVVGNWERQKEKLEKKRKKIENDEIKELKPGPGLNPVSRDIIEKK